MIIIENGKWKFEKFLDYSFRSKFQKTSETELRFE